MRSTALAVAVLLLAAGLAARAATPERKLREADRHQRFGDQALKAGNLRKAEKHFGQALAALPGFPDALLGLGHVAMARDDPASALGRYSGARDAYADMGALLLQLRVERHLEAQRQAVELRTAVQQMRNQQSPLQVENPASEQRIRDMEEEVRRLEQIDAPIPGKAETEPPARVHFFIGNALFKLGRHDEAATEWEICVRHNPKAAMVLNNLAVAYWKLGRLAAARSALGRAEALDFPVNPEFKRELAAAE